MQKPPDEWEERVARLVGVSIDEMREMVADGRIRPGDDRVPPGDFVCDRRPWWQRFWHRLREIGATW